MPTRPPRYPVVIDPSYVAELRQRVEAAGVVEVARAARMSRQTIWRALAGGDGRRPNADAIERIGRGLAKVDRGGRRMPPALVSVRGTDHFEWIRLADQLSPAELSAVVASPAPVLAAARRRARRG